MTEHRASPLSAGLCNASMLLYILWLMLPCLQRLGHALTGCLAVGLFAAGVLLDGETLPKRWRAFVPRVLCALLVPFVLWRFLDRGASFLGFYAQQVMFWFPLLWVAYARERGDERLYRHVGRALLIAMALTTLTTTGWLIEGILRGGGEKVYAYARSLGFAEPGNEAYLRELMLRNIGGYDFIYASVLSLPLTCYAVGTHRGWKRAACGAFLALQLVMIVLSQYTYALVFAALIVAMEALAALLRLIFRRRALSVGASLLWTLPVFLILWLARVPLLTFAVSLTARLGFENASYSLTQLLNVLTGATADSASRLAYYRLPLEGFAASPLVGSIFTGAKMLSQHSDLLDLLSGVGALGTLVVLAAVWLMGRGGFVGLRRHPARAHLCLQYAALLAIASLGTVVYSREIALIVCLGFVCALGDTRRCLDRNTIASSMGMGVTK